MMSARQRVGDIRYDNFLDEVAVMTDDQYWDAYGSGSEFGDTNWHWITFAVGDTGWGEDGYLWVGGNKGIAGILGLYRFPTRDGNYKRRIKSKLQMLQALPMRLCVNDSNEFVDVDFGGDKLKNQSQSHTFATWRSPMICSPGFRSHEALHRKLLQSQAEAYG